MAEESDPQKLVEMLLKSPSLEAIVESSVLKAALIFDQAMHKAGYSEEVAGLVRMLAAKSNDTKEETILKALTLYGLALDAREKGNRLAILSADDEIVHDVIGFDSEVEGLRSVTN